MGHIRLLVLVAIFSISAFSAVELGVAKLKGELKVAEISATTSCKETNTWGSSDYVDYDCKIGSITTELAKKLGSVVKVEGMDRISNYVLSNSVDREGKYSIKLRVLYY